MNNNDHLEKPNIDINSTKDISQVQFDVDEIWKIVLENIRMYVSQRDFATWFKHAYLEKIENGVAEISVASNFQREWIESHNRAFIKKTLLQITGQNLEVMISINSELNAQIQKAKAEVYRGGTGLSIFDTNNVSLGDKREAIKKAQLNPKYIFTNFIVGSHNQMAHAVAEAVASEPGVAYNPVFYYGPTGVGKTHLMQAIGNEVITRFPDKKVLYISIEQFLNEMVEAIRTNTNETFRKKYRAFDVLIIDDMQFIETYHKTQEELFHTFNTLYQANKQIIMAADRPPREIKNLTDRLRSRFEGGMVMDILAPDYETRMAILKQLSSENQIEIPKDVLELVAKNIENNVRELEGAATKVISMVKFGKEVTLETVSKSLQIDLESKRKRIKPEKVLESVSKIFDVSIKDIKGNARPAYVALARQTVMFLLRTELGLQLEKVALEVKRKDHTTVLHACDKIEKLMEKDSSFKDKVLQCKTSMNN